MTNNNLEYQKSNPYSDLYAIAVQIQNLIKEIPNCESLICDGMPHDSTRESFFWSNPTFTYYLAANNRKITLESSQDIAFLTVAKYFNEQDKENYKKLQSITNILDAIIQPIDTDGENASIFISKDKILINTGEKKLPIFIHLNENQQTLKKAKDNSKHLSSQSI